MKNKGTRCVVNNKFKTDSIEGAYNQKWIHIITRKEEVLAR